MRLSLPIGALIGGWDSDPLFQKDEICIQLVFFVEVHCGSAQGEHVCGLRLMSLIEDGCIRWLFLWFSLEMRRSHEKAAETYQVLIDRNWMLCFQLRCDAVHVSRKSRRNLCGVGERLICKIWWCCVCVESRTFAMTGALAWQVKVLMKIVDFVLMEGDGTGVARLSFHVCLCLHLLPFISCSLP